MATSEDYSLEIAKAAVESASKEGVGKLAAAIGGMFPFWGLKKRAVETYISEIENSNLSPEVKMMTIANTKKTFNQLKNQSSIANIALQAAPAGTNFTETSSIDDEWLERFMDAAKFVSDEKVQLLWGNILAKEFEQPSSTPPSVVRILSEITPFYANVFQVLCSLSVHIIPVNPEGRPLPPHNVLILPVKYDYLSKFNINLSTLNELQMLGLIQFDILSGYALKFDTSIQAKLHLAYGSNVATILKYPNGRFPIGCILLTDAGRSIARFVDLLTIDEHFNAVVRYLEKNNVKFAEKPEFQIGENI